MSKMHAFIVKINRLPPPEMDPDPRIYINIRLSRRPQHQNIFHTTTGKSSGSLFRLHPRGNRPRTKSRRRKQKRTETTRRGSTRKRLWRWWTDCMMTRICSYEGPEGLNGGTWSVDFRDWSVCGGAWHKGGGWRTGGVLIARGCYCFEGGVSRVDGGGGIHGGEETVL